MSILNEPIVNLPFLYVNGLNMARTSLTAITVATGQCRDSTNSYDIANSATLTLVTSSVGVNALDTGTVADSTVYAVYLISDWRGENAPAGLISTNFTNTPVMPSGYNILRRIGSITTDASGHILIFYQYGTGSGREVWFDAEQSVLSAGSSATFAAVALNTVIPSLSNISVYLNASFTANAAGDVASLRPTGSSVTAGNAPIQFSSVVTTHAQLFPAFRMVAGQSSSLASIDYIVQTSDSLSLYVVGYTDQL
jgi:hypothetical protein